MATLLAENKTWWMLTTCRIFCCTLSAHSLLPSPPYSFPPCKTFATLRHLAIRSPSRPCNFMQTESSSLLALDCRVFVFSSNSSIIRAPCNLQCNRRSRNRNDFWWRRSELWSLLKNAAFCYMMTPCGSCNNRRLRGTYSLHLQGRTLWVFYPEHGGDMFLRNVGSYKNHKASSHPRRQHSTLLPASKHQILYRAFWTKYPVYINFHVTVLLITEQFHAKS
jgi:hypothetical protein